MPRQDCSCSCDFPLTTEVEILGVPVRVKNYMCARDGAACCQKPQPKRLELTILPTGYCDAHCPFCIAAPTDSRQRLDPERLYKTLLRLRAEDAVRGISISGGEPTADIPYLDEVTGVIFDVFPPAMEVSLDTNGTAIGRLKLLRGLYRFNAVHVSRHHWDDGINERIFGRKMPTGRELADAIAEIACPDLFVLNCLMMKDVVDTPEKAHTYLDFAIQTGACKAAFITAAPVNPWIRERLVDFDRVLQPQDERMLFTRSYRDFSWCRCHDGIYVSDRGKLIEFYGRQTLAAGCDYCRGLVYGPDDLLRAGFGGKVLNRD